MGKMPWLKLYTEIRTDPKMQALSDAEFRIWINLLCLAAESKVRGVICIDQGIPYPDEALARAMYTDPDTLKGALAKFTKLRMVDIDDDGIIYLINFDARQYDKPSDRPEAVAERVRRHRAKAKAEAERQTVQEQEGATAKEGVSENDCNADVTPLKRQSNALDTDKETDKDSGVDIPTLTLPTDIYTGLTRLQVPDDATEAHKKVAAFLERNGFYCRNEFRVPDRGDGRPGKIDIYAERGNLRLAIEIDRETPREKSIYKLRQVKGALRLILLRAGAANIETPEGVDVVISLAGNARPETVEDVLARFPRYSREQLNVIRDYWETIRFTRKTGKIAPNIVAKEMDYWERFPVEVVLEALDIHMRKYQSKREDYTAGIMRRLLKERELEGKGVKLNEQGRQPPRASPGTDAGAGVDLNKFLWKGT